MTGMSYEEILLRNEDICESVASVDVKYTISTSAYHDEWHGDMSKVLHTMMSGTVI